MLYTGKPFRNLSYRNRYRIATANGPLLLSIPLKGGRRNGQPLAETEIDYTHDWQRQHWRTLFSAYGRASFYEHFGPELEALLFAGHKTLLDFNLAGLSWLCKAMQLAPEIRLTEEWAPDEADAYGRLARPDESGPHWRYCQVFEERLGFLPDLSVIDLLMAEGPHARDWILPKAG